MCHNAYIKESTCRKRKRDRMIQKKTETPKDQNHWSHSPSSVLHTRDTAAAAAEKKQHQQRHQTFRKAKLQTDRSMMMWWYNLHKHVRPYTQRASRAHIDSCEERVFLSRQKKQINLARICEISKYKKYCSTRVTRLTHLVPKELFCYLFVEFSLNFEYFGSRGQPHQPMMQLSDALKWHIFEPLWVMIIPWISPKNWKFELWTISKIFLNPESNYSRFIFGMRPNRCNLVAVNWGSTLSYDKNLESFYGLKIETIYLMFFSISTNCEETQNKKTNQACTW